MTEVLLSVPGPEQASAPDSFAHLPPEAREAIVNLRVLMRSSIEAAMRRYRDGDLGTALAARPLSEREWMDCRKECADIALAFGGQMTRIANMYPGPPILAHHP